MTTFLHASDAELDIGTILRSDRERYARRWWRPGRVTDVFRRMEELRPPSCRSHGDAVFMMSSMDDLTGQAFGYRRYIYEITPVLLPGEQVERYDLGWIDGTTADDSTPLSRDESCRNYWSGAPARRMRTLAGNIWLLQPASSDCTRSAGSFVMSSCRAAWMPPEPRKVRPDTLDARPDTGVTSAPGGRLRRR
ncbi:hypothetical protein AD929_03135 [Gluconobacter potus]|uniref:Uncharacterized protein n=1 Tax=Gluconobacter potus TaxID=2724927 RepID=A0A149QY97_9PROT|nr:hypothetical protein [Gluconobacter potus]KXV02290.1 hypothetical protein AD929_03135 [Gluconobacter potus]